MTDPRWEAEKAYRAFAETEIGKLFLAFERAHANAWQVDTRAGCEDGGHISDKRLTEAWAKSAEARTALVAKLKTAAEMG